MDFIQVTEIGRCARELNFYPALVSDPVALLALELERYWDDGAIIVPVQGEENSYAVCRKPSLIGGKRTIKIRIVKVDADADTQSMEAVAS